MPAKTAPLGVVLCNIGGPSSADPKVVRAFLKNFFSDPAILPVNPALRWMLARSISRKRAPISAANYAEIGGRSPILDWTDAQARGLETRLNARGDGRAWRCAVAMRYSPPFTEDAIAALDAAGCNEFVVLPLYPHECCATTGSSFSEVDRVLAERNWDRGTDFLGKAGEVRDFAEDPVYLAAVAERIEEGFARFPVRADVHLLFSAHGLPKSYVDAGDPYARRIDATIAALLPLLAAPPRWSRAYQSRVGREEWLGPDTIEEIRRLARDGVRSMLVVPISFVSDHVETLHEIGIQYASLARECGVARFECTEGLNGSARFLEALEGLVLRAVAAAPAAPSAR